MDKIVPYTEDLMPDSCITEDGKHVVVFYNLSHMPTEPIVKGVVLTKDFLEDIGAPLTFSFNRGAGTLAYPRKITTVGLHNQRLVLNWNRNPLDEFKAAGGFFTHNGDHWTGVMDLDFQQVKDLYSIPIRVTYDIVNIRNIDEEWHG